MPNGRFNWGYMGAEPENLAFVVLLNVLGEGLADKYKKIFSDTVIAQLPLESFDVKINLTKWLSQVTEPEKHTGFIHSYEFMEFKIRDYYFSKFLDVTSFDCSSAIFEADTKEYELIKNMHPKQRLEFIEYLTAKSTEKVQYDGENVRINHAMLQEESTCIRITNLLGDVSKTYTGTKLSLWT